MAAVEKKKALDAVQKQGFNKQTFTSIEFIQAKPNYTETYDKVIEATENLTPFEQFLLLMHIEDMKEERAQSIIQKSFSDSMEIIHKDLLTNKEQRLVNEVLGFMFTESICFQDYRDVLVMELSPKAPLAPLLFVFIYIGKPLWLFSIMRPVPLSIVAVTPVKEL